jgi:hypothetical protein
MTEAAALAHVQGLSTVELRRLAQVAQAAVRTAIATRAGKTRINEATRNRNLIERTLMERKEK